MINAVAGRGGAGAAAAIRGLYVKAAARVRGFGEAVAVQRMVSHPPKRPRMAPPCRRAGTPRFETQLKATEGEAALADLQRRYDSLDADLKNTQKSGPRSSRAWSNSI